MFVYRVNSVTHISLDSSIIDSYIDESLTHNLIYGFFGEFDQFDFLFKRGTQVKALKVYFKYTRVANTVFKSENNLFVDVVEPNVFEMRHIENFITVKQHPKESSKSETYPLP